MPKKKLSDRERDLELLHEVRRKIREYNESITPADMENVRANFAPHAEKLIEIFRGLPNRIWWRYDDQCWRDEGFWLARSVRNHPVWGKKLFEVMTP